jgi:hypothetical protein
MKRRELVRLAKPEVVAESVARQAQTGEADAAAHHAAPMESVRQDTYKGHSIVVRTTYHLEVDGQPLEGHMGVTNDGQVHYHAIPNLGFASAIDVVKQIIDTFPEDFPPPSADAGRHETHGGHGQGSHDHGDHDHGDHDHPEPR